MIELDEFWEKSDFHCPTCKRKLLCDTHEEKEATHYCKKCKTGLLIMESMVR